MKYRILMLLSAVLLSTGCGTIISQIDSHNKIAEEKAYRLSLEKYEKSQKAGDTTSIEKYKKEIDDYTKITAPKYNTGCTIAVPNVYSGVSTDLTFLLAPWSCRSKGSREIATIALYPLYAPFCLADTFLSTATDTLILPYTIYRQARFGNIMEKTIQK